MDETQFNNIYEESRVHKTYNDTIMKNMSSLEILCKASDGKCWTEKNYQKSEIFDENVFADELLVFDARSTKIWAKPFENSPTSK